jgi:cytochrome c biogenesis factor
MILYVIKIYTTALAIYVTYFFYSILSLNYDNIIFADVLARTNLNLSYWDLLYFLWTNLFYMYMYFLPCLICYYWLSQRYYPNGYYITIVILVGSVNIYFLLLNVNLNSQELFSFLINKSNLLLTNNINKYHPLMLHLCLNFIMLYYLNYVELISKNKHNCVNFSSFMVNLLNFNICFITMVLGSWWAYQEGSWGGWWAWDPSEVLGLLILLILALLFHLSFFSKKLTKSSRIIKLYFVGLYLVYFCLQSNFSITSHNFGFQNESSIFLKIYYYTLIFISLNRLFNWWVKEFDIASWLILKQSILKFKLNYYLQVSAIIIFVSLVPLLTDLLWKIFTVNFINFNANYYVLVLTLLLLITMQLRSNVNFIILGLITIFFWVFFNATYFPIVGVLLLKNKVSIFYVIHTTILALIIISLFSTKYYYSEWIYNSSNSSLIYSGEFDYFTNVLSTRYPFFSDSLSFNSLHSTLSVFTLTTVAETSTFNLLFTKSNIIQEFLSDNGRLKFSSIVTDNFSPYILILIIFLLLCIAVEKSKCYIIRC